MLSLYNRPKFFAIYVFIQTIQFMIAKQPCRFVTKHQSVWVSDKQAFASVFYNRKIMCAIFFSIKMKVNFCLIRHQFYTLPSWVSVITHDKQWLVSQSFKYLSFMIFDKTFNGFL